MDLLKDNVKKLYFRFLVPSLGSAMVMSVYTLTDAIVIGKGVGAEALAALSITTPLLCILMATGILFGVGASVQVSVQRGSGNVKRANNFFSSALIAITAVTLVLWLTYSLFMTQLLRLMGANQTLLPYAQEYMHYINIFLPVAVFSNFIAICIRADNDPNRAMAGVLIGGVVNIILDIVLVFPMNCGIGGAALASAIGMVIQVCVGATHFLSKSNGLKLVRPDHLMRCISQIAGNGTPSFFNEFANGFIVLLFNIQILRYCGEVSLSVYSVVSNCVILFNSLFTGVGQAITPLVSTNYGAGKTDRINSFKRLAYITILICGIVFSLSGVLLPAQISGIFLKTNNEINHIASKGLRMYFITFVPMGINLLTSYYLQSVLKVKQSLFISLMRNIFLSSIFILAFPVVLGPDSIWAAMPATESLMLIASVVFMLRCSDKKRLRQDQFSV